MTLRNGVILLLTILGAILCIGTAGRIDRQYGNLAAAASCFLVAIVYAQVTRR
jgi:hypothetical protein